MTSPNDDRRRRLATLFATAGALLASAGGGGADDFPPSMAQSAPASPNGVRPEQEESSLFLPDMPIVLRAIVEPIGADSDGSIVQTIGPAWRGILGALARDADALRHLTPRQMEELVAASYEQSGFDEVILTPRSGDLGRDVIATKRGFCTVRIIDQVKHYAPEHRVSADEVRALLGVLLSDERATKGFVTTTSTFAPGIASDRFISKHMPFRLELVDGKALLGRLLQPLEARR